MAGLLEPMTPAELTAAFADSPASPTVAGFVPSEQIRRLDMTVDVDRLRAAALAVMDAAEDIGDGFIIRNVTRRPGQEAPRPEDLSGRYWMRNGDYEEEPHDPVVDESAYSDIYPEFQDTYVAEVIDELRARMPIGRARLLGKASYNCNSWHRDPEPRIHIPIVTNPGALFVINHHVTHLPADGSVYFTDTRAYHTALNGGSEERLSLVAAIALETPPQDS